MVVLEPFSSALEESAKQVGVTLLQLADLEEKGKVAGKTDFEVRNNCF